MTAGEFELRAMLPTAERIRAAHWLLQRHTRICVPEPSCQCCLRTWPCADVRWAHQVLGRQAAARITV